jgi:outer membrane protein assembly factor BamB
MHAMKTRTALDVLLVLALAGTVSGAAAQDDPAPVLQKLAQRHEDLLALRKTLAEPWEARLKADKAAGPVQDFALRFEEGADRDEMLVNLSLRGGRWAGGYATVPAWRHESYRDRRGFYIENKIAYVWRDKFRYPIQPTGLALAGNDLGGTFDALLRLNALREERMPPGTPLVYKTGEVFSWLDRIGYLVHERLRKQHYDLRAQILDDVQEFDVVLEKALNQQHSIYLRFHTPNWGLVRTLAWTPTFNQGHHSCDASGLAYRDGKVEGTLAITIRPDAYFPKSPIEMSVKIEGRVSFGRVRGVYKHAGGGGVGEGIVTGRAGRAVLGRYASNGEMGAFQCWTRGMASPVLDQAAPFFQGLEAGGDAKDLSVQLRRLHAAYRQVRALQLALREYPLALENAWDQSAMPEPRWRSAGASWSKEDLADVAACADALVAAAKGAAAEAGAFLRGTQVPPDPAFGPFVGSTPLTSSPAGFALPADIGAAGAQKWCHLPEWQVAGPFPQTDNLDQNLAEMPDIVSAARAHYVLHASGQPKDAKGQKRKPAEETVEGWRSLKGADGKLEPPWSQELGRGGFRGTIWFASSDLVSDKDRDVWISVAALDHAKLWVNGRLAWVGGETAWPYRREQESIFNVALKGGPNRLLVRCREDRCLTWLRLHVCVRGEPKGGDDAATDPPLAWDLEKGTNVSWRASLPGALGSRPVAVAGGLYVTCAPAMLVGLDAETGKVSWKAEHDAPAPAAASHGEDAVLCDGRHVWALFRGGLLACCDAKGGKKWAASTGMSPASLRIAGGRLLVHGVRGGEKGAHAVVAFDPLTGKEIWKKDLAEPYKPAFVVRLARGGKTFAGLLTHALRLLDAASGEIVLERADLDRVSEGYMSVADDAVYFTQRYRRYAGQLLLDADGQAACRFAWSSYYPFKYDGAVAGLAAGRWFFTTASVPEDLPGHSPIALRELNLFDRRTGEPMGCVKPVVKDTSRNFTRPTAAGPYLFVQDVGSDAQGQMAVVPIAEWPVVVCTNRIDRDMTAPPVFDGTKMFLRKAQELVCVSAATPEGRKYQDERVAAAIAENLGRVPRVDRLPGPSPLPEIPVSKKIPLSNLADGKTLTSWLIAGPFPSVGDPADVATLAGVKAEAGAALTLGGAAKEFQPVDPQAVKISVTRYNYHLFEGLGMGLGEENRALDVSGLTGGGKDQRLVLYTVVVNCRPRLATLQAPAAGVDIWMGGMQCKPMSPLQLAPGAYPLTVLVRPEFLAAGQPLNLAFVQSDEPVEVREAWLRKLARLEVSLRRIAQSDGPAAAQAAAWMRELEDYKVREDAAAPQRSWRNGGGGRFPDARPPVPMEPTTNLPWKATLPDAQGSAPVASATRVYLGSAGGLLCLSAGDGKKMWQADLTGGAAGPLSPPAVDGDTAFIASASGAVAAFGADGKPRWTAQTAPAGDRRPWVLLAGQVLIVQNGNLAGLDAGSGKILWGVDLPKGALGAPVVARIGIQDVVFTASGCAVRASDGNVLSRSVPPAGEGSVHVRGDLLVVAGPGSVAAFKLPPVAVPGMALRPMWEKKAPARAGAAPLIFEDRLAVLTDGGLAVLDAATGADVQAETLPPAGPAPQELLLGGDSLFVTNVGPDARIVIFRLGKKIEKAFELSVPGGCMTPTFVGRRMYIRSGGALFAIGGEAPRQPEAFTPPPAIRPPEGYAPAEGVPMAAFESNQMPRQWLIAGPFKPKSLDEDFLKGLGGRKNARPAPGQAVKAGGADAAFQPLDPKHFWRDTKFTGGYEAVDLRDAMAGGGDLIAYLFTVLDNDQPRYAELILLTPKGEQWNTKERLDYKVWIGSVAVKEGDVVRLEKGKIPILIQAAIGTLTASGKVWFAPRWVDRTSVYAGQQERFDKANAAWQAYLKGKDQLLILKP